MYVLDLAYELFCCTPDSVTAAQNDHFHIEFERRIQWSIPSRQLATVLSQLAILVRTFVDLSGGWPVSAAAAATEDQAKK